MTTIIDNVFGKECVASVGVCF